MFAIILLTDVKLGPNMKLFHSSTGGITSCIRQYIEGGLLCAGDVCFFKISIVRVFKK
jgi:hypothetical protein